jgi:glyoxylase-like metal-dependent hydrolase (beta-lactamase superfamily II)
MEIYSGAHLIPCEVGGRPLTLTLLVDENGALLFDAGTRAHAESSIPEYFRGIGLSRERLRWLIISHPDLDHCGGAAIIARNYQNVRILCGNEDREQIEDPSILFNRRYDRYREEHGIFYDEETAKGIRAAFAGVQHVSATLAGGEVLRLGPDRLIDVLLVPGHSPGHLALYDRRHRVLFYGDAIQGSGYQTRDRTWVMGPTYLDVDAYLDSIARIRTLDAAQIVGCHWPQFTGSEQISRFCDETKAFVERTDAEILLYLASHPRGVTLAQLCQGIGGTLGAWPSVANIELCYPVLGDLERATRNHKVTLDSSVRPVLYRVYNGRA